MLPCLRCERYGLCSRKREGETGEDREVSVKPHAIQTAYTERREAVVVLQAAELALDGGAATVEVAAAVQSGTVTLYDAHCHTTSAATCTLTGAASSLVRGVTLMRHGAMWPPPPGGSGGTPGRPLN